MKLEKKQVQIEIYETMNGTRLPHLLRAKKESNELNSKISSFIRINRQQRDFPILAASVSGKVENNAAPRKETAVVLDSLCRALYQQNLESKLAGKLTHQAPANDRPLLNRKCR